MDQSGTSSAYDSISGQYWYRYGNTDYVSGLYGNAANYDGSGDRIVIFRKEEAMKVSIHELVHFTKMDFS
jgi:hypothetical protein